MKNIIGIVIILILGVTAYLLLVDDNPVKSRNTEIFKDFSIEDTASVTKIFMSQSNGKQILLTRNDNGTWTANNKFEARKDAIRLILKTLHDVKVAGPVPQKNFEGVVKRLASISTKVEYYTDSNQPEKTWYVGDATESKKGTYMLLEKDKVRSSKPFITHMLMERGVLNSRFFLDTLLWRERVVVKAQPKAIKSVEVIHFYDTATSFRIERAEQNKFLMTNLKENVSKEIPSVVAIPYLKQFKTVYYEYLDIKTPQTTLDSVYSSLPRHIVNIKTNNGEEFQLKTYHMPVREGITLAGKPISYHPERMYIRSSYMDPNDRPVVQNFSFDAIAPPMEKFESSTTVEK